MGTELADMLREAESLGGRGSAELFAALYRELHRLARSQLRQRDVTLGATTLLHEAYLQLASGDARFPDRARFFAYAARAMRGLIVDHARSRRALKRGGAFQISVLDTTGAAEAPPEDLRDLSAALKTLEKSDPRLAELVDLKFFCGFSFREIAEMRGVSERTVQRDWRKARLYLHLALEP